MYRFASVFICIRHFGLFQQMGWIITRMAMNTNEGVRAPPVIRQYEILMANRHLICVAHNGKQKIEIRPPISLRFLEIPLLKFYSFDRFHLF